MGGLVVVTRPLNESAFLAAELTRRGYDVLVEPMLYIAQCDAALPLLDNYQALAFTSANGVDAFITLSRDRTLPAFAVGGHTADALRKAGFAKIHETNGDAATLAREIMQSSVTGARILHASGKAAAQDLGRLLSPHKIIVDRIVLYEAIPAKKFSECLVQALYACTVKDVLLFSARTAATFGTLVKESGLTDMIGSTRAVCLSNAIASEAAKLSWGKIVIAVRPTADALLDYLPPLTDVPA